MTAARSEMVNEKEPGTYHCTVRCVRRAYLCGVDPYTGQNYNHRKEWIHDRLAQLTGAFGVNLFAYAVMSDHFHIVLRTRPDLVQEWSDEKVVRRWLAVYTPRHKGPNNEVVHKITKDDVSAFLRDPVKVAALRQRVASLSWFIKSLNEYISRKANREDDCRGRFWESRYKSQHLLDEGGLLACMCFVDLNQVRLKLVKTVEASDFTSLSARLAAAKANTPLTILAGFKGENRPFNKLTEQQYLDLVTWTGRQILSKKHEKVRMERAVILASMQLDASEWVNTVNEFSTRFCLAAGTMENIRKAADQSGKSWLKGCLSGKSAFLANDDYAE